MKICDHDIWLVHYDPKTLLPSRVECSVCHAPVTFDGGNLWQPAPINSGNLWQPSVTPDAALRSKYASAVRTLQLIATEGGIEPSQWSADIATSTLTQLGEPVEP